MAIRKSPSPSQLNILGVQVIRGKDAPPTSSASMSVIADVENVGNVSVYAWSSIRRYDYDAPGHVLTVDAAEWEQKLPPGIIMLSDHVFSPAQIEVSVGSRVKIRYVVPQSIRRLSPSRGSGPAWTEEPIGQIVRVDISIQYGPFPVASGRDEPGSEYRKRLLAHGEIAWAQLAPMQTIKG